MVHLPCVSPTARISACLHSWPSLRRERPVERYAQARVARAHRQTPPRRPLLSEERLGGVQLVVRLDLVLCLRQPGLGRLVRVLAELPRHKRASHACARRRSSSRGASPSVVQAPRVQWRIPAPSPGRRRRRTSTSSALWRRWWRPPPRTSTPAGPQSPPTPTPTRGRPRPAPHGTMARRGARNGGGGGVVSV